MRRRALFAFALGTVFFAYAFIQRVAPSIMTGELMRDFGVGGAAVGSLSAWYFYTYASIQLPVGMLTDRFGPRRLMSAAMAICAMASIAFALSDSVLTASLGRALVGASVGFGFVGTLAIASDWFPPARFAMLAGITQTAGMLGGLMGQAPLRVAVEAVGWRGTMVGLAVVAAVLSMMLFLVIPRRPAEKVRAQQQRARSREKAGIGDVFRNRQSWCCAAIGFGLSSIMLGFVGLWGVPWLNTVRGFSLTEAAAVASTFFLGWALFAPICGWLTDHLGRRKPIMLIGIMANIGLFTLILHGNIDSTALLSILFFVAGAAGSSMTVVFSAMRELNASSNSGAALGLVNMCVVGAGAVSQPLVGWLLDRNWSGVVEDGARIYSSANYEVALLVFYITNLMALVGALCLRETHCRQVA